MSTEFYEYTKKYTSELIRGQDVSPRPELTHDLTANLGGATKTLLDIGCGTAHKTATLATKFREIIGLEPSEDLIIAAQHRLHQINNIRLIRGVGEFLPFQDNQFDVVTAVLSWWQASEVSRVLKPGGVFLIERLGPEDKNDFTQFFGRDELGWRGANLNTNLKKMQQEIYDLLNPFFSSIEIRDVSWETAYCAEGLWLLLKNTYATVRNFNEERDKENFERAIGELAIDDRIVLQQNRLVVIAS